MGQPNEIYDKYLTRAISEINDLTGEMLRCRLCSHSRSMPVIGSGHPLADIMLLKFDPKPAEIQEGVAFFGRSGQAILKSLQRLHVDPMAIYGTNCLKLAGEDEAEALPNLSRELQIVQPRLVVIMGEEALRFVNALDFPLAEKLEPTPGSLQRFTATIEVLYCPDIDASLDEQAAKTAFWKSFKLVGPWWAEQPPY